MVLADARLAHMMSLNLLACWQCRLRHLRHTLLSGENFNSVVRFVFYGSDYCNCKQNKFKKGY